MFTFNMPTSTATPAPATATPQYGNYEQLLSSMQQGQFAPQLAQSGVRPFASYDDILSAIQQNQFMTPQAAPQPVAPQPQPTLPMLSSIHNRAFLPRSVSDLISTAIV